MSGGGGGDGGSAAREEEERARRASSIDAINAYFGVGPAAKTITTTAPAVGAPGSFSQHPWGGTPVWNPDPKYRAPVTTTQANPLVASSAKNKAGREALYGDTRKNVLDLNLQKLSEYASDADRTRRFGLARGGQRGSSVDIDSARDFRRAYDTSATDASRLADSAALDFRTSDEKSRLNLINQINAGADANTTLTSGVNQLSLNADEARLGANNYLVNNVFNDLAKQYAYGKALSGTEEAARKFSSSRSTVPGQKSYSGTVS